MPLVLVHNDVVQNPAHQWDDVEGVHYHYPSKYLRKITMGEPFVYYRGVHRENGKRGPAEYVGSGRIGRIWSDPNTENVSRKAWYCAIEDYQRFPIAVPAKTDGLLIEDIPANLWRDGVRSLERAAYARIMELAGATGATAQIPAPAVVAPTMSEALIVPSGLNGGSATKGGYRRSKQAKAVGDWAEKIVLHYIQKTIAGCTTCVHRAGEGETPGWDIDYVDPLGVLQRVEVKGTVAGAFTGVDLTAGEMRAAKFHRECYWLYLVAGCLTPNPKIQAICNPAAKLLHGEWAAKPAVYTVRFAPAPAIAVKVES